LGMDARNSNLRDGNLDDGIAEQLRRSLRRELITAPKGDASVVLHLPTGTYLELDQVATEILGLVSELGEAGAARVLSERYNLPVQRARADVLRVARAVRSGAATSAARGRRPTLRGAIDVARGWWRLPLAARIATCQAALLVLTVEVALKLSSLDAVARRIGAPLAVDDRDGAAPPLDETTLTSKERLHLWAVRWVLQRWLFDATCLRRALAWGRVLRARRPALCIGLVEEDGVLAHAWLHFGDVTLDAPDQGRNFSRL
jgi:Transglutaminase-like superfamily/Coenzyme PQQ synthesis protein D (PqqD)